MAAANGGRSGDYSAMPGDASEYWSKFVGDIRNEDITGARFLRHGADGELCRQRHVCKRFSA